MITMTLMLIFIFIVSAGVLFSWLYYGPYYNKLNSIYCSLQDIYFRDIGGGYICGEIRDVSVAFKKGQVVIAGSGWSVVLEYSLDIFFAPKALYWTIKYINWYNKNLV